MSVMDIRNPSLEKQLSRNEKADDILVGVDMKDHQSVLNAIKENGNCLWKNVEEKSKDGDKKLKKRTLFRKILEDTVNGNKIVEEVLNTYIKTTAENENDANYGIEIDFSGLASVDPQKGMMQTTCVNELLDLRAKAKGSRADIYSDLLKHPLLASLITLKWEKVQKIFCMKLLIFVAFVVLYSVFLCCILVTAPEAGSKNQTRLIVDCESGILDDCVLTVNQTEPNINQEQDSSTTFASTVVRMIGEINKDGITAIQIMLGILIAILVVEELVQASTIGLHYFQEMENYIEWSTIICAFITVIVRKIDEETHDVVRGLSAIGICLAYLELIFLTGRYPFKWCDFGVMFYRILTRLLRYVFALLLIIIGHAFAFTVNMHSLDAFKSPWKSFVTTLTRSLGEFGGETLYNSIKDDENTTRVFAMIILVSLIFFGTITMINLFIAVIITDLEDLKSETFTQNLINMAHAAITAESALSRLPGCYLRGLMTENRILCLHDLCPEEICEQGKVPENFEQIIADVKKKIAKGCFSVKRVEDKKKNSQNENNNSFDIVKESL